MNILLLFYVFFNVVDASEYYCTKTDSTPTNWDEVEKFMNDPNKPSEYKFNPTSLPHAVLNDKCKNGDIVIVRRMKVKIADVIKYSSTRDLFVLEGQDVQKFVKEGGICHKKYNTGGEGEVEFSGRGELTEKSVLHACGYRELLCGDEVYQKEKEIYTTENKEEEKKYYDLWCRYNLQSRDWTTFFTDKPYPKIFDDELICDMDDNTKEKHGIICLKEDCSSLKESKASEVCSEDKKIKMREYSYTKVPSPWGNQAFLHFFRNYILTLAFYCYFMMQARRQPIIRYELAKAWDKFKSGVDPKDDDENNPIIGAKKRENYLDERGKMEFDRKGRVKKATIEHMKEELQEAKNGISIQATFLKDEDGESASNRPPNVSLRTKLLLKEPCNANDLRNLIQWSWVVESQMVKSMNDDDFPSELAKFYALEAKHKIDKIADVK
ncbi:hypothetical protein PRIPAC_84494 [Pristionchus pacificus]|nr:hypothetical protein PRIPAC_84494 [Pristionchus pacificus]